MEDYVVNENKGCTSYLPCAKFTVSVIISLSTAAFGGVMLVLYPTAALAPFYSSLISGCVMYWVTPPSNDKK